VKVPIRGPVNQTETIYGYQMLTRLPHPKVDTVPIEFWAAELLSRGGNRTIHDVQSPFAHFLRRILEVDYDGFRVREQNVEYSKPAMNHAGVVNPFNCVDNVLPEATKL
jgi:hypothetical protein